MSYFLNRVRAWPIRWQIGALFVLAQILANIITGSVVSGFWTQARPGPEAAAFDVVAPFALLAGVLYHLSPERATEVARAATAADPRLSIKDTFGEVADDGSLDANGQTLKKALEKTLGPSSRLTVAVGDRAAADGIPQGELEDHLIAVRLADGSRLVFAPSIDGLRRVLPLVFLTTAALLFALPLVGATLWATVALVPPLDQLAKAAERFQGDLDDAPIAATGSAEIRKVAKSFNAMRQRTKDFVDARARTLAAIGHDLRTPLTRMRLRAEMLDSEVERSDLLRDVQTMESLTNSALRYLRDQNAGLDRSPVDLAALAQTVSDEFAATGASVEYCGPDRLVLNCDGDLIRRALTNLVENGVNYAGGANVRLDAVGPGAVAITVEDDGPGIAASNRDAVLEPFRRGDTSRKSGVGFGLGLSIVRDIAERHGGSIELGEKIPHGLVVRITLPVSGVAARAPIPSEARA